jgi:type III secretory pathway component EscR
LSEEEQKSQKITKKKNESTSKTTSLASIRQTYDKAVNQNSILGFRNFIKEYEHEQRASYYVNLAKKKLKKLEGVNEITTTSSSEASSGYTKRQAYLDYLEAKVSNTETALRNFLRKHARTPNSESYRVRARKLLKNF